MKRFSSKVPLPDEKFDVTIFQSHIKLYKVTKNNMKYQFLYGIMLLFLILIPLSFFIYLLVPNMISYQFLALARVMNILSIDNIFIFFLMLVIIQIIISTTEETIFRGFIAKRGADNFNLISAAFISSFFYGFTNFLYFLNPLSGIPLWYPFIWFTASFIIGMFLSLTVLRRKWLFPAILANFINKVIMIYFLWNNYVNGVEYIVIILYQYLPLLVISLIIFVWQFKRIKESISIGIKMIKPYFKTEKNKGDLIFQIILDLFIGFMIFVVGFLITI